MPCGGMADQSRRARHQNFSYAYRRHTPLISSSTATVWILEMDYADEWKASLNRIPASVSTSSAETQEFLKTDRLDHFHTTVE